MLKLPKWRTVQHADLVQIDVGVYDKRDGEEITLHVTGGDSDDDDMYCYIRMNIQDAFTLINDLMSAIRYMRREDNIGEVIEYIKGEVNDENLSG